MSRLGELLAERKDALVARWLDRVRLEASADGLSTAELRDHVPLFVVEICDALHGGLAPSSSNAAKEHGRQREELGFDVDAVVREYGILLDVILDFAEGEGCAPSVVDVRVVTRFITLGINESVAAHRRHQDRISQTHEARIAGLFRTAPAFMAALQGPRHVFTLVNEPYERIVGVGRSLLGLPVAEALPETVPQGFVALLDEVYRSGVPYKGREVPVRLDRRGQGPEDTFIDFVYQPTHDRMGAVNGIDVFGFDVTEQVRARQQVEGLVAEAQAREAEVTSLVDALPVLAAFVGADARYRLVNKAYESWFGVPRDVLRGQSVASVIGPVAWAKLGPHVERALAGERFRFEEHDVPYGAAGTRDIAVTFVPRRGAGGQAEGYVSLVEDITARRHFEKEREQLLVAEREALREADVQRAHLRTVVATAPIGIATWRGPDHVFESANTQYLEVLQRSPSVIGQAIRTAFSEVPADHPVFAIWDAVYRTGTSHIDPEFRIELVINGQRSIRYYLFNLVATRDPDGVIDGLMACFSDVTEVVRLRELVEVERDLATAVAELEGTARVASDEARARTEFLLRVAAALGESLDLGVVLQRLVGIVAPSYARTAGVWSAFAGAPFRRVVHSPSTPLLEGASTPLTSGREPAVAVPVERVIATGETFRIDDYAAWMRAHDAPEASRASEELAIGQVLYLPIRRGAEVVAVLTVGGAKGATFGDEDVVVLESVARLAALAFENARLFGEMAALRRTAEDATVAKDRFLAHVSHDLRNPLSSILGWSTLLRGLENLPPQVKRGIDVIERNAKSQVQLIEDLLDISRIASGKLSLVMSVEDVRSAVDTALDAARLAASSKKVRLDVLVDQDIGAIAVDPDRFRQIVWNLVSNAVKFTPAGGTVRVAAKRVGTIFQLEVIDDGRGIAPAFLPRVFGAFEQAEDGTQRAAGLGLGLAIAKQLVELHGGTIRVESEGEGRGTRFVVELPIRAALRPLDATSPPAASGPLAGLHLLVVDDEEDARDVITVVLEQAGATVTGASSVDDALDRFREVTPDAVVSDIAMPGRDGKDFVRELRCFPEDAGGRAPVVALTAFVGRRDRQEILAAGFDAHVAKPVEPAELVSKLAELVGRKYTESKRFY